MTKSELSTERIIMVALMKSFSEQSVFMIGEFKQEFKQSFNNLIKRTDEFIIGVESELTPEEKQTLQSLTDVYHNFNIEARRNLNKTYKDLENDNTKLSPTMAGNMAAN